MTPDIVFPTATGNLSGGSGGVQSEVSARNAPHQSNFF